MSAAKALAPGPRTLVVLVSVLFFGSVSLWLGQDASWDLRNYHFYGPYAALGSRAAVDHNPAAIPTHFNPTLDILTTYPLHRLCGPATAAFVMGGFQGLCFALLLAISLEILRPISAVSAKEQRLLSGLSAVLGLSGAMVVTEIGTANGDLTLAVLNLLAFWLFLRAVGPSREEGRRLPVALGGLAAGAAAGLKLVNAVFCAGLVLALFLATSRGRARAAALATASAAGGAALTHGWWSVRLWSLYGNPVFPLANGFFHSPLFPERNPIDTRFLPQGLLQNLFYPFYFSWNHQTAELPFRDLRFPVAYLCVFLLAAGLLAKRRRLPLEAPDTLRHCLLFSAFVVSSYVTWQVLFSYQRYAVTLELLIPTFLMLTLVVLLPRRATPVLLGCAIALAATTRPPDHGRIGLDAGPFFRVRNRNLPAIRARLRGAAVVVGRPPLAYLAPALDVPESAWIGSYFNEADRAAALRKIRAKEAVYLVTRSGTAEREFADELLRSYGLPAVAGTKCRSLFTNVDDALLLCRVEDRRPAPPRAARRPGGVQEPPTAGDAPLDRSPGASPGR